ncbi:MAG: ubiquitin-conjugating enzyme E2 [Candidatus Undinarchaeales archaeon]|nr:ubiquitin-conjugating enzyme E2 [Candidatus Undinarchaeales archaeon]
MSSVAEVNLRERVASAVEAALSAFARLHDRPLTLLPLSNGELAALDAEIDGDAQVGPRQQVRTLVRKAAGRPIMLVAGAGPVKTYTMARMARDAYDLSLCMATFIVRELEHLPEVLEAARLEKRLVAANNLGRLGFRVQDERGSRFSGKVEVRKGPIKGSYRMDVLLPPRFPDTQPFFRLVDVPRHPNVYDSGDVCLGHFVWNPALDITVLVEQVRHVLENPNYEDGLHREGDEEQEELSENSVRLLSLVAELVSERKPSVTYAEIRQVASERGGMSHDEIDGAIQELITRGEIFEPQAGRYQPLI